MSSSRLVQRLKGQDPEAQAWLFQTFNSRLFFYFRSRIKGESQYEDLVQEVFGAFFKLMREGKTFADSLVAPVMFGIARRVMYNFFYRQKRQNKIQERASQHFQLTVDFEEEDRLERTALRRNLNEVIDRLNAMDKTILRAFYLEEKNIGEIAAEIGKSHHYVSVRKERALKKMRGEISRRKDVFKWRR